jgi:fido (protein-threonine AMPylation protein)
MVNGRSQRIFITGMAGYVGSTISFEAITKIMNGKASITLANKAGERGAGFRSICIGRDPGICR